VSRLAQRCLARTLIACGLVVLLGVATTLVSTAIYRDSLRTVLGNRQFPPARGVERIRPTSLAIGVPIGTLEIVRVGLGGVVVEGDHSAVLAGAIGHLPDTPLPWNDGNSALAAHRDGLFKPLKGVRVGDLIRLRTPYGTFDYSVRETLIVSPEDLWVLDQGSASMLTLISCYPFTYVGPAPRRFIVRADRIPAAAPLTLSRHELR
jgi:LPXTG-site transpeptidase (sortase) family protein